MQPEDRVRILHILDACETVSRFITGHTRKDLDDDDLLLFALTRAIEIIGEAASRVTESTRRSTPTIPWLEMSSMRNRLIHAYFEVDRDVLWQTAIEDVPSLARELASVVEEPQ